MILLALLLAICEEYFGESFTILKQRISAFTDQGLASPSNMLKHLPTAFILYLKEVGLIANNPEMR